jgi:nitroimidazol reductase NimA-like FMN-containing flavoprotein (pyridoxamine 5'-phosphate oxidase superfamily)
MGEETTTGDPAVETAIGEARVKAGELLASAQVGFLSLASEEGPYCVPISFAYDGEDIYFHGGEGKKSRALEADPRACLTVTSDAKMTKGATACKVNFQAASVVAYGTVTCLVSAFEKDAGLRTLIAKYYPEQVASPLEPKQVERTTVYRMTLRAVTYRELPGD